MDPTDGPHLAASVRGGERGGKGKAGLGREKVTGRFLGCGKRKRKKEETGRDGPAGLKRDREKEKFCILLRRTNAFNLNSNSRIQIQTGQQTIKQCRSNMNATPKEQPYLIWKTTNIYFLLH
jgi:hypothetical protein